MASTQYQTKVVGGSDSSGTLTVLADNREAGLSRNEAVEEAYRVVRFLADTLTPAQLRAMRWTLNGYLDALDEELERE